jgi:hypothetical protein
LMPYLPEYLPEGFRIERRAIGGDTAEGWWTDKSEMCSSRVP